ncbi:MAG: metallophosphoesterase [Planctomycetota bacterium]|jgi:hypothetical protein
MMTNAAKTFAYAILTTLAVLATGCASTNHEPFTVVVIPDTQCYCDLQFASSAKKWGNGDLRQYFFDQTHWIKESADELNTSFAVHEGDITQTDYPEEWEIADEAMSVLDGHVPYCLTLGNHDMGIVINPDGKGYKSAANRETKVNDYFPQSRFENEPWFGGSYEGDLANAYYLFAPSGIELMVLSLEFNPRDEVLAWANGVCQQYPDRRVIVLTHSYMNSKGERIKVENYATAKPGKGNSGEAMWEKLVSLQPNIFMVLCGHSFGDAYRMDTGVNGNPVHQVLCDYQNRHNGGESWLRYMTFYPDEHRIAVHTYNPALDEHETTPNSRFDIYYSMTTPAHR